MAGSNDFLINNGSDVQFFSHGDVFHILDKSHRLANTHSFGCKTGEDIFLRIGRQGAESLGLADTLFSQESHVSSVAIDDHDVIVIQQVVELMTAYEVAFYEFGFHVVWKEVTSLDTDESSPHDHQSFDVGIVLLADQLTDIRYKLLGGHEIGDVAQLEFIEAPRNNRSLVPLDSHNMIGGVWRAEIFQLFAVECRSLLAQLDSQNNECSAVDFPPLSNPRTAHAIYDFLCGQQFWINQ